MRSVKAAYAWHRPLMAVAAVMVVCAAVCVVGMAVDDRQVLGVNAWVKPFKFSVSIAIYAVTWAWIIAYLPRWRRTAHAAGTIAAIALLIEQAVIVGAAAFGTTSHFNVSTGLHTAMWTTMGTSIAVLYVASLVTTIAAFFLDVGTRSTTLALRIGAVVGLAGLGLAFLMTAPTAGQLDDFQGVVGAHAVGVADGGPGLPLLGWSTVAGDLRIPHFVGMHALQALPLFAILLAALGRRWRPLADDRTRTGLVVVAGVSFVLVLALVTAQALAGQSIVRPDGVFLVGGWALALGTPLAMLVVLSLGARRAPVLEQASA